MLLFASRQARGWAALALIALGIGLEFAQGQFTSYRTMDIKDALANTLGVVFGQGIALTPLQTMLQRWDHRLR